jgi:AcrR family transcriptional regulator
MHAGKTPADRRLERTRARLVEAATALFAVHGFRGTTMEAIAKRARVAKATAYAYFADKEEVFRAVIQQVAENFLARAEAAAAAASTPEAAVLASLSTKQLLAYDLLHASGHGAEVLEAVEQVGGALTATLHARYVESLARWVARCKAVAPEDVMAVATVLDHAAYGLGFRAPEREVLRRNLAVLVRAVVGGPSAP